MVYRDTRRLIRNSAAPSAALYLLFGGICLSDLLDGAAARGLNAESALGGVLDVSADGLFIFSSLILFNLFHVLPVWFTALVLADFLVFLTTSRFLIRIKRKSGPRVLIFDVPGRMAAVLFYFTPIAAWTTFSHPARQILPAFHAPHYLSAHLSAVSMSERLFLCGATLWKAKESD